MQQMSLSQKLTEAKINGMKSKIKSVEAKINGMEARMNGVETKINGMEAKMNGMDTKMHGMDDKIEELKINLNKLLQEMATNGERVVKETHDEKKINVNHDFIDSNVGSKTHHISKINMRKFDGKDPATWIL